MIYTLIICPLLWASSTIFLGLLTLIVLTIGWRAVTILLARKWRRSIDSKDSILITGATSGIGLAVAKHLYKIGYSVVIGYFNSNEPGYAELKELSNCKVTPEQRMIFLELDVKSEESIAKAYEKCSIELEENKLRLYALINNAGLGSLQPFAWLQRKSIRNLIETNLLGSLLMAREFLPLIVKSKGRIINVSSGLGFVPGATYATYGLTKSAQVYFTRSLNMELRAKFGVKTVAVVPHNFIKNTNICSHNVKTNQLAWEELKPLERQLYDSEFQNHCQLAKSLEEATKEHSKLAKLEIPSPSGTAPNSRGKAAKASRSSTSGTDISSDNQLIGFWNSIQEPIKKLLVCLQGENAALTLEQSGALECFEDALRLLDPPEHIFAGDNIYNIIIGSVLLSVPASLSNLLGSSVASSLYR